MLNRERQASNARASPPPTYRSNAGTLLRFVWTQKHAKQLSRKFRFPQKRAKLFLSPLSGSTHTNVPFHYNIFVLSPASNISICSLCCEVFTSLWNHTGSQRSLCTLEALSIDVEFIFIRSVCSKVTISIYIAIRMWEQRQQSSSARVQARFQLLHLLLVSKLELDSSNIFFQLTEFSRSHDSQVLKKVFFFSIFQQSRPPILFQRQSRNPNNVQVEIPFDNSSPSNNSINGNSSMTSECSEHQSTTSSQTITTIASINRLNDNEFTLMSATRETAADGTSLIKQNGRSDITRSEGKRRNVNEDENIMNQISHENLNCSSSGSRNINCNKDYVSVMDHNTAVNHCKNVNISNTKELNKALIPLAHLSPSQRNTLTRGERTFHDDTRCEMGIR